MVRMGIYIIICAENPASYVSSLTTESLKLEVSRTSEYYHE